MNPSEIVFAIALVLQVYNGNVVGSASGFFMMNEDNEPYFITNRHVVESEDKIRYDELVLKVHSDSADLTQITDVYIPLSNGDYSNYLWYQDDIDIVAIPLDVEQLKNLFIKFISIENCPPTFMTLEYGTKLSVIGFPRGFTDYKTYIPILKSTVASSPPKLDFNSQPLFIMDGNLKRGMSGAPVFTELTSTFESGDGIIRGSGEAPKFYFLGIHSATYSQTIGVGLEPAYKIIDGKVTVDSWREIPIQENLELHTCYLNNIIFYLINQ